VAGESALKACAIDSSVAVKWFSEEADTGKALALREAAFAGECRLEAPDLLLYEIGNALRFNSRLEAGDVVLALEALIGIGIVFHPAEGPLLSSAVELAFRHGLTVYDGCFVALAGILGVPLITADEKLIEKTAGRKGLIRLSDL